jgi:hypothetical protein
MLPTNSLSIFSPNCIFFAFCIQSLLGVKCLSSINAKCTFSVECLIVWNFWCLVHRGGVWRITKP